MNDFAQSGLITTLQRLNDSHLASLETALEASGASIALVLPCHSNDLDRPPLAHIVEELMPARFLSEIFVTMNGPDRSATKRAATLFNGFPCPVRVLWNESDGKGGNVAGAFQIILDERRHEIIATQDCDVASFRRHDLARLCMPIAAMGYQFSKSYYSRATDRLYGRVTRLFVAPLLQACTRVLGHHPLLDFLASFRFPLAGEVAMTAAAARLLPVAPGWALELAMLCDVFRTIDPRDVCQVDGGSGYDHKHQPASTALAEMAGHIAAELFRQLQIEGLPSGTDARSAIADAYRSEASHALRRSKALAQINALAYDAQSEQDTVAAFHGQLSRM
ncbi:MAG: Glucosyl-3-phosphoglycerate synthase [Verrucomicrobiota bacterium]|jgi:glucosyl-3-phosphoglycerate synthase